MKQIIFRFIQGTLIGACSILPGISGGMLCLLFGVYEPIMALLASPLKTIFLHFRLFIPLILGGGAGFLGLAQVLGWAFEHDSAAATCLFLGLAAGSLPSIAIDSGPVHRKLFCISFFGMPALMLAAVFCIPEIVPNPFWYFICGAIWALSLILPGLSSSTLLIFLGLYQPMTASIAALELSCILPLGAGLLLTVLLTAQPVGRLLRSHRSSVMSLLLGAICASCLLILPIQYRNVLHGLFCLLCALTGFCAALILEMTGRNMN